MSRSWFLLKSSVPIPRLKVDMLSARDDGDERFREPWSLTSLREKLVKIFPRNEPESGECRMKHVLSAITAAITVIINPVLAQTPPSGSYQPRYSPTPSNSYNYRLYAPTPRDAYRERTINRWEYQQLEGPLPPAFQGPSPDGGRGGGGAGS